MHFKHRSLTLLRFKTSPDVKMASSSSSSCVCHQVKWSNGQMLSSVEASQDLVPSSRLIRPCSPFGGLWWGQSSMMWSTVCSSTPHSQAEVDLRPHFFINAPNLPTPVRRRLNVVIVKMAIETHHSRRHGVLSSPYFENETECKYTMKL